MEQLITIKQAVKEVLEECPKARNSDKILMIRVFNKLGFKLYIDDINNSPSFESIRRSRQKTQRENPLLQADKYTQELRYSKQKEYKETFR